MPFVT